ncbi:glycerol-3-phosphate 1-O-acyltransferase PlsY [Inediibacterium massiliense]|uniref:glycerol-3-phosphate 1-O-acyltransferase PlsY n=1 Tax=Inediibacterium massiliense TaxID=1658111 RepID=UPI0006B593DF|nr:glycerol-3-phosphate 1-O-acyltransferase PlsY [Inediibacterium massiliense]
MFKILAMVISYLLGNFSTSVIVSKVLANIDIRNYGSGNAGATNVYRTLGAKAAIITLLGDALKGVVAVALGRALGGENTALICGVLVIIGHNWPVLFGFKGGKGIATAIGVGLSVHSLAAMICIFIGIMILIKSKYVSLASITAISIFPFLLLFDKGINYFIFGLVIAIMALYRHRQNIERLMKGIESKIR